MSGPFVPMVWVMDGPAGSPGNVGSVGHHLLGHGLAAQVGGVVGRPVGDFLEQRRPVVAPVEVEGHATHRR